MKDYFADLVFKKLGETAETKGNNPLNMQIDLIVSDECFKKRAWAFDCAKDIMLCAHPTVSIGEMMLDEHFIRIVCIKAEQIYNYAENGEIPEVEIEEKNNVISIVK